MVRVRLAGPSAMSWDIPAVISIVIYSDNFFTGLCPVPICVFAKPFRGEPSLSFKIRTWGRGLTNVPHIHPLTLLQGKRFHLDIINRLDTNSTTPTCPLHVSIRAPIRWGKNRREHFLQREPFPFATAQVLPLHWVAYAKCGL